MTLLLLGCLVNTSSRADDNEVQPDSLEALKSAVATLIDRYDIPAIGIAMVDENGQVWVGALGKANLEQDIEADERSLFRIASTSKMFVGLSVLIHHRNNVLDGLDPNSAEGIAYWAIYLEEWVRMNHVRTIAPLATAVLLTVSLRLE